MFFYLDSSAHAFTNIFGMWKIGFIISREKLLISAWSFLSADFYQNICDSKINFTLFTMLVVMNHIQNHQKLIQKTAQEKKKCTWFSQAASLLIITRQHFFSHFLFCSPKSLSPSKDDTISYLIATGNFGGKTG